MLWPEYGKPSAAKHASVTETQTVADSFPARLKSVHVDGIAGRSQVLRQELTVTHHGD